jgi:hypothetical protein
MDIKERFFTLEKKVNELVTMVHNTQETEKDIQVASIDKEQGVIPLDEFDTFRFVRVPKCSVREYLRVNKIWQHGIVYSSDMYFLMNPTEELKEYDKIMRIDKNKQFFLGKPKECIFNEENNQNKVSLKECSSGEDMLEYPEDLTLLIMKDGGINIELYANKFINIGNSKTQYENIKKDSYHLKFRSSSTNSNDFD